MNVDLLPNKGETVTTVCHDCKLTTTHTYNKHDDLEKYLFWLEIEHADHDVQSALVHDDNKD